MWVTKSQSEVVRERHSSAQRRAFVAGLIIFVLFSIDTKVGYRKWAAEFHPITWNDYFHKIPLLVGISVGVYIVAFLYFRKFNIQAGSMCMKCEKTFSDTKSLTCECGGQICPVVQLKWVECQKNQDTDDTRI